MTPIACLVGYALWTMLLVLAVGAVRVLQVVTGAKAPNAFPSGTPHGSDSYWRLNRAHLNATENLPIFGAIVLSGMFASVDSAAFATLALITLCARVAQSVFHISSGASMVVNLRFTAYLVQLGCMSAMALEVMLRVSGR